MSLCLLYLSSLVCRQLVLAPSQDEFFRSNMYANYGDLSAAVTAMVNEYSKS